MTAGLGRTLTYTSYNMPAQVVGVGYSGGASTTYNYVYNAEHERTKLVHSTLGTFIYLHPAGKGQLLYEKQTEASPSTRIEHKYYISAGGTSVAVHYARENPNLTETTTATRYLHQDHLGSITLITNEAGGVTERLAYEAYGKRRYPAGTDDPTNGLFGQVTDRGFTSHEHLDEIALIHMNGRVYDPVLGRFVTADPFLQHPDNLQDYNRYSYVNNNPLMYTDPTGYLKLGKVFRAVVTIAAIAFAPQISAWAQGAFLNTLTITSVAQYQTAIFVSQIVGTAASGFAIGVASGGTLESGLRGAVSGGIGGLPGAYFGDVYSVGRVMADTLAGGVNARINGGGFVSGLRSSFGISALTYVAASSRLSAAIDSAATPGQIGDSPGVLGVAGKYGGERINEDEWFHRFKETFNPSAPDFQKKLHTYLREYGGGPLGGNQAGPGTLFGFAYSPGGLVDKVVEIFSGIHDSLNRPFFYTERGTSRDFMPALGKAGFLLGEGISLVNVAISAPVAGAALIPEEARWLTTRQRR